MSKINLSQSLLRNFWQEDTCFKAIEEQYIKGRNIPQTEPMLCGLVFEHYLIGGTRDGSIPSFPLLKSGKPPKIEGDMMELVERSKPTLEALGIVTKELQPEWVVPYNDAFELGAHPDILGSINYNGHQEECILDIKWTGGRYEDKWNGWADISMHIEKQWQPKHYVYMYYKMTKKIVPFYFLVFGKSGWKRLIKCVITKEQIDQHGRIIEETIKEIGERMMIGWEASPECNKCQACAFSEGCESFSHLPKVQEFIF